MVNRGEEKVRVHLNVVPRSTMNTNGDTELTLKCKFRVNSVSPFVFIVLRDTTFICTLAIQMVYFLM